MKVAYVRISHDPLGLRAGVERQRADCMSLAGRLWPGETLVVYEDNDVSAYSGAIRDQFVALCDGIRSGRVSGVVAYNLDRMFRQPRELEAFLDLCQSAGFTSIHTCEGDLNLSSHDGQLHARILTAVAKKESDDKSRRIARAKLAAAEQGRKPGGPRPFGYSAETPGVLAIVPAEADLIRSGAAMLLRGSSVADVRRAWAASGVCPPRADCWQDQGVRSIMLAARNAGLRSHRGKVVGNGEWPAIITPVEHAELVALLAPRRSGVSSSPRSRLLAGLVVCGRCGRFLSSSGWTRVTPSGDEQPVARYLCKSSSGGCSLGIDALILDEHVKQIVLATLEAHYVIPPSSPDITRVSTELVDAEQRLNTIMEAFAAGDLSADEWQAGRAVVTKRIDRLRVQLDESTWQTQTARLLGGSNRAVRDHWDSVPLRTRVAVVRSLIERVVVNEDRGLRVGGRRVVDLGRVVVGYRD